jgi:hypothetical protein
MSFEYIEWRAIFASFFGILLIAYYLFDSPISPKWEEGPAKDPKDSRSVLTRYYSFSIFAFLTSMIMWTLVHGNSPPSGKSSINTFIGMVLLEFLLISTLDLFAPLENPKNPAYRARSRFVYLGTILAFILVSFPFL